MMKPSVVVVGGGLSGLSAALSIAQAGDVQVTILEKGDEYGARLQSAEGSILCGLGGAGTLSGGKLCFPPASKGVWRKTANMIHEFAQFRNAYFSNVKVRDCNNVTPFIQRDTERVFCKHYENKLVLKEEMNEWVSNLISSVEALGVIIRCNCEFLQFKHSDNGVIVSFRNKDGYLERQEASYLLLGTGRTSTALLHRVLGGGQMLPAMPDLGIRLSLDRKQHSRFAVVGKDVKLKCSVDDFLLRTFCVCSGGDVVKVSNNKQWYFDGHFGSDITNVANLGILARTPKLRGNGVAEDYLNAMQKYVNAGISLSDFMKYYKLLAHNNQYEPLFSAIIVFVKELQKAGIIEQHPSTIPVMIPSVDRFNPTVLTSSNFETFVPRVFVVGDAAGVSRGFVQALWSGHCAAERIKLYLHNDTRKRSAI